MTKIIINDEPAILRPKDNNLILNTLEGTYFIPLKEVIYLKSNGSYTIIHSFLNESIMVSQHLGSFNFLENDERFFRVHQSFIINLMFVRIFLRHRDGEYAVVEDGTKIPVSRRRKEKFLEKMSNR